MSREGQISKHFRSREGVNSFTRPGRGRAKSRRYTAAFWRGYFRIPQGTIATRAVKNQFVDGTSKRAREVATALKQIGNKSGHKFWKEVANTIDRLHTKKENYRTKMSQ